MVLQKDLQVMLGCFSASLGSTSSLFAKLNGAMMAIEFAEARGWRKLWLESDSTKVVSAFDCFNH